MTRDQWIGRLALGATVTLGVVVLATIALIAVPGLRSTVASIDAPPSGYRAGDLIDLEPSVYGARPQTLLLFTRHDCAACVSSAPAFRLVVERLRAGGVGVVMVVNPTDRPAELLYAAGVGIGEADLLIVDQQALRLKHVPALVVVDQAGRISYARAGAVSDGTRDGVMRDVLDALR